MKPKILIVDDDQYVRESIQEYLTIKEFDAESVQDAEHALEYLEHKMIDIILTDIIMPGMDGLELTDTIKKNECDCGIIIMTGFSADYSYEEAITKGANDIIFKPIHYEELVLRIKRVLRERRLNHERSEMIKKLDHIAKTDGLTKLYNSRFFYRKLKEEISRFNRNSRPLSLLMIDIDRFKKFNDAHGHIEGDKILRSIAATIKSCLREHDTGYRYGGEEFTVILPETNVEDAASVADRIREAIQLQSHKTKSGNSVSLTVSIGVTHYLNKEKSASFVDRTDKALYLSKQSGRNKVSLVLDDID